VIKCLVAGDYAGALRGLAPRAEEPWTADSLSAAVDPYYDDHERIRLDAEARNGRHTYCTPEPEKQSWRVSQVLVDPDELNDWQLVFTVHLPTAREEGKPVLCLESLAAVV
jgi:hypothetical protein